MKTQTPFNKIPVCERAVAARLRRHWAKEGLKLKKLRGNPARWWQALGDYHIVDGGQIHSTHINIEEEARAAGLLRQFETMVE